MKTKNNILVKVDNSDIIDGKFEIPNSVTSIDGSAFYDCNSLTSITYNEVEYSDINEVINIIKNK